MTNNTSGDTPNSTNKAPESLGIAGKTAQAFIHSPLSPLLFLAMLAMGVIGLIATPRQEDPQISVPMIDVFVSYPGASTQQVAAMAIEPLERMMSEIPGIKHVYSVSQRGRGVVTMQFKVGEETSPSLIKVHDKLASNVDKMPRGVQMPPLVKAKGIDDVPVVTLTLWSPELDSGALRHLGLTVLQNLKEIPNTGEGFVSGGQSEEIRVEMLPDRLAGYGLTVGQVAKAINGSNQQDTVGTSEFDNRELKIYAGAFLKDASDVEELVVGNFNGRPVYVRDVAEVSQTLSEVDNLVGFYSGPAYAEEYGEDVHANGELAVTVAVSKKVGSNGVDVANAILARVDVLKETMIPDNVQVSVTRNYGATAKEKVDTLLLKLAIATGVVTILVWWALGFKPAVVVTVVIPVVILMTVFPALVLGMTTERVSLFALIFSIGILVDDAIVVVENVYRRWLIEGKTDTATAVDAIREVGNPTILATFTVVAALLPMAYVSGMMGPYMAPIPTLGSVAMMISLFAAFSFTAWLVMRVRPSLAQLQKAEEKEHKSNEQLDRLFRRLLPPLIESRAKGTAFLVGLVVVFFAVCSMFYFETVTVKMLPFDNKSEFTVVLDMPEGTSLPATANVVSDMASLLQTLPEVTALQSYIGTAKPFDFNGMVRHYYLRAEPWQAEIQVQLAAKSNRSRSSHQIATAARALLLDRVNQAGGRMTVAEIPPGPPVLQSVVAEIYGPDERTRREVAQKMTELFEAEAGVADVDNFLQEPHNAWQFTINRQKASLKGVSVQTVLETLKMTMGGYVVDYLKAGSVLEPTNIVLQAPLSLRANPRALADLPVPTQAGGTVPLAELGRFELVEEEHAIFHKDLRAVQYVVGDAIGRLAAPIYPMLRIEEALQDYKTPDGLIMSGEMMGTPANDGRSSFEWGGEWTVTYETFRDMGLAFGVALILIYMLVVGLFGNFVVPAVIMAPIPLTMLGIVPGHWLVGLITGVNADFTATSMIGFIALAGIIVRNSILLVDFSVEEIRKGVDVKEAVLLACKARTRPIMITAFALMGGASVILTDPIFQGMAISLMFGVLVSTVLTLMIIPLGCVSTSKSMQLIADARDGKVTHD